MEYTRNDLITVNNTSQIVSNAGPRKVMVYHNSSTGGQIITLALGIGVAVANYDIVLKPGDTMADNNNPSYQIHQGSIQAIASAAGALLSIYEA